MTDMKQLKAVREAIVSEWLIRFEALDAVANADIFW